MLIGRHLQSPNMTNAAIFASKTGTSLFHTNAGKVTDEKKVKQVTGSVVSVMRGSEVANLMCFDRATLLHARQYTVSLLEWAERLGFCAVTMEAGAAPETKVDVKRRLVASVRSILSQYQGDVQLLIENCGRAGNLATVAHCMDTIDDDRLGVALHLGDAYVRGYEVYDLKQLSVPRVGLVHLAMPDSDVQCGGGVFRYGVIGESAWSMRDVGDLILAYRDSPIVVTCKTSEDADIIRKFADRHDDAVGLDGDFTVEHREGDRLS